MLVMGLHFALAVVGYHIAKYASYQGCTFCHEVGSLIGIADAVDALKLISINLGEGLSVKLEA